MAPRACLRACRSPAAWAGLSCLLAVWGPARAEETRPDQQLLAVGNDQFLWLVVGRWEPEERLFLQRLAYLDSVSARIRELGVPAQKGRVKCWAVVGERLHLFFENHAHQSYTVHSGCRREKPLPDGRVAEAMAGEATAGRRPILWAVVRAPTADEVEARYLRESATQPEGEDGAAAALASTPARSRAPNTFHLVAYDGLTWRPGVPAPEQWTGADGVRMWLDVSGGQYHLCWQQNPLDKQIAHAWRDGQQWLLGPPIPLSRPPARGSMSRMNKQLVFAALVPDDRDSDTARAESFVWRPASGDQRARWEPLGPLQADIGGDLRVPLGSAIGAFKEQLVLLQMRGDQPEVGFWRTEGGRPDLPFRAVPLKRTGQEQPGQRGVREITSMLIVAAMLLLVFWRRQESLTRPVALPAGLEVAGLGRRGLAALIDMAPAAGVVAVVYRAPLRALYEECRAADLQSPEELQNLAALADVLWVWVWFVLAYTAYCTVFELASGAPPGKRLMGCEILSETLGRPNAVQVLIRNLTRLVEFFPHLQIWPFLLVIFFTRNRQRIGDLLARTIVVERRAPVGDASQDSDPSAED